MVDRKAMVFGALAALTFWVGSVQAQGRPATDGSCASVTPETCAIAADMGRGTNLGEMLEAPREGDWGLRVEPDFIDKSTAVFKTIRLPVRWTNHAAPTEDATLDDFFAERVDNIINALLAKNVYVILDLHHYSQLFGAQAAANETPVAAEVVDQRFLNVWKQLAERYKDKSPHLIFELLNEPHARMQGAAWNTLGAQALAIVRKSNPSRVVMFGGGEYNHPRGLPLLVVPKDRNLIVPIHTYDPFIFTHQGTNFNPLVKNAGVTCCDKSQRQQITDPLDAAKRWSIAKGYPLVVGEFGTYRAGEMPYRAEYTRFVRDEIEKRGWSWTFWDFIGPFGAYDGKQHVWIEPLRAALLD